MFLASENRCLVKIESSQIVSRNWKVTIKVTRGFIQFAVNLKKLLENFRPEWPPDLIRPVHYWWPWIILRRFKCGSAIHSVKLLILGSPIFTVNFWQWKMFTSDNFHCQLTFFTVNWHFSLSMTFLTVKWWLISLSN